jgi:hypothetical protein
VNTNPFTFGNPVRDPSRFFGRQQEIRQITSRLASSAHESTSVVGERRIGKTSLLNFLAHPEVSASLGLAPESYCLVYIDFQGLTDITPRRFWQRVLAKIGRGACDQDVGAQFGEFSKREDFDLFDLEDLFETAGNRGLHIVLLLDEFEYVTQNPNFTSDFFGGLRALAIHRNLSLVPATRRELVDLCHSDEIKGSPFFNIFANVVLRPFSPPEVDQMVEGYLAGSDLTLAPEEKEMILKLAGGHPFFVQMAGYYLFEAMTQGLSGEALKRSLAEGFAQQAESHFSYLWSHCSESERITLLTVMGLAHQKPSPKAVPKLDNLSRLYRRAALDANTLAKRGLLVQSGDVYSLFSPSFDYWIGREIAAGPQEQESPTTVETWLAEGGRENLQPMKGFLPKFKRKYWPLMGEVLKEISFEVVAGVLLSKVL